MKYDTLSFLATGINRNNKIDALTSLRFFAAAMIVVHHTRDVIWLKKDFLGNLPLDQGVSFFFVLSGFILTVVYPSFSKKGSIKRFYIARIARIWPAHFLAFLTLFAIFLPYSWNNIKPMITITNILMIHSWVPIQDFYFSYNAVSWSISVEFFFYLIFPLLLYNFANNWRIKFISIISIIVLQIFICNYLNLPHAYNTEPSNVSRTGLIYVSPLVRMLEFFLGMFTAYFWMIMKTRKTSRLYSTILEVLSFFLILIILGSTFKFISVIGNHIGLAGSEYLVHMLCAPAFALFIYSLANENGYIAGLLSNKILVILGEISYSLYLFHQLVLRFYTVKKDTFNFISEPLLYLCFWILILIISYLIWRFIEKPTRKLIVVFWDKSWHFKKSGHIEQQSCMNLPRKIA